MSRLISVLELRSVRGTGGGPEKTILLGAAKRDQSRFAVTVCYIRDLRDEVFAIDERARAMGVDYIEVKERHSFDPGIWRALRTVVRDRHIDIVHAHDYKTDLLALLLSRRTGVIPLATAHNWAGRSPRERLVYYPLDKRCLARFPHVIAVSTPVKNELIRHGAKPKNVTVILNAIDPAAFRRDAIGREEIRHEIGLRPADFVIGTVGRLQAEKRFDLLIQVFARLAAERADIQLVLVGDGQLKDELTSLAAKSGVTGRCRFLGHRSDVVRLHHAFDLYVQSSDIEGTPNAVLEAMAMQTPVVATDVGGTREIAHPGVHALIVPSGDAAALKAAIEQVLSNPASARERAVEARRRIECDLSFEARTRALERIYSELYAGRRAPHA